MSDKVKMVTRQDEPGEVRMMFWCPGCQTCHVFRVKGKGDVWDFNHDYQNPTFSPSLLTRKNTPQQCHLYMKNGKIEFLSDCCHALAGETVDVPDVESWL